MMTTRKFPASSFTLSSLYFLFVAISNNLSPVSATYDICQGRNGIGGECEYNSDCAGFAAICKNGRCDCHYNYQVKNDSDGSKYCVKLPDSIGAPCSGSCRFPMFCTNGKCQCVRAKAQGSQCLASSKLGDSCTQHSDCSQPFTACSGSRCACITGTANINGQCVAAQQCPDGAKAVGSCVRYADTRSEVENQLVNSGLDSCPSNFFCYTDDVSQSGHCCPLSCPYKTAPDAAFSCAPGAANPCPSDTHYCHRLSGQAFSASSCCRRPCKDPTPVYVNGQCYARAWLGGPCSANEQCLGGDAMQCANGVCVCRSGFSPNSDSFVSSENPPQTCVRTCPEDKVTSDGECYNNANLDGQCDVDDQCPSNSKCLRGRCVCDCNQGYSKSGGGCARVAPTTAAPGKGVTNSGQGGFLGLLGGLVKGNGGGGGGGGGGGIGDIANGGSLTSILGR